MSWQVLSFISLISYALAILTQRVLMKNEKSDSYAYSIVFQLTTGAIIGIFGFFTAKMSFSNLQPVLLNLIITTVLWGLANIFIFSALKLIEASEFTIIFSSRILITIIASTLLLKEGLNLFQFLGVFLILSAVILVTYKSKKFSLKKGAIYALLGAVCFGLGNTNDRIALKHMELYSYVTLSFILPTLFTIIISPKSVLKIKQFLKITTLSKMLFMCILYSVSSIAFFSALQTNSNSSQTTSVSLLSVIFIVILSAIFLKERDHLTRKIIGAILSILGGIILIR